MSVTNFLPRFRNGESVKISARTCFNISYNGDMKDIGFFLLYPPRYGKLVKLPNYETAIKTFDVSIIRCLYQTGRG